MSQFDLSNEKIAQVTKSRNVFLLVIAALDVILVPWLMFIPIFIYKTPTQGFSLWMDQGIIGSYIKMFKEPMFLQLFGLLQIPIAVFLISVAWNPTRLKKRVNKVSDGVGGPPPAGQGEHGTSRWQTEKEMSATSVCWKSDENLISGGVIFGSRRENGKEIFWFDDEDIHTLLIGTTRSGKSRKILLPSIWEIAKSGESMVIGDPKGELYIMTKPYLEKEGYKVLSLNLRDPSKGIQWNILSQVIKAVEDGDLARATELTWDIANTFKNQQSASSEPIWENGEEASIAALILIIAIDADLIAQKHMASIYSLLARLGTPLPDERVPLLEYLKSLDPRHPGRLAFAAANMAAPRTRASFFTQVLTTLRLFSDPNIAEMTSHMDHDLESIGIEKTAVFLIVPDEKPTRNVLATLYIDQTYQALVDLSNKHGGRIPRRVNFLLDEFGNLPAIPKFDSKLTVAGGRGMRFCIAVQDLAQLEKLYDKNARTIRGNCHNWIYILTSDQETAELVSKMAGTYTIETGNFGVSAQDKSSSVSANINSTGRPLLMPDEILRWPENEALVIRVRKFPARYPCPDLSQYKANSDYGMSTERAENYKIIQSRWDNIVPRVKKPVLYWEPNISSFMELPGSGSQEYPQLPKIPPFKKKLTGDGRPEVEIGHEEPVADNEVKDFLSL